MGNPTPVMRLTAESMAALREIAKNQPELWRDPGTDFD